MEKTVELSMLLAYYGEFLTQRQRKIFTLNVDQDMSLSEIAELEGISRQGVHDMLRRAQARLEQMEQRLGLIRRTTQTQKGLRLLENELMQALPDGSKKDALLKSVTALRDIWEDENGV